MDEGFIEVIELLSSESHKLRKLLNTPCCSTPISECGKKGYFDIGKYMYKLEKAIEILATSKVNMEGMNK